MKPEKLLSSFEDFFTAFQVELNPSKEKRFQFFLENFRRLNLPVSDKPKKKEIGLTRATSFLKEAGDLWLQDKQAGRFANFWTLTKLGNDENLNNNILRWLFDVNGDHGQGDLFFKKLVFFITQSCDLESETFAGPSVAKVESYYLTSDASEKPVADQGYSSRGNRIDIEISNSKFLIFIEVKIKAQEQEKQLERYVNIAARDSRESVVLFLTPDGRLPENITSSREEEIQNQVIPLSWRRIHEMIIAGLEEINLPDTHFLPVIIRQYARHIYQYI